jgi:hypothetical protein
MMTGCRLPLDNHSCLVDLYTRTLALRGTCCLYDGHRQLTAMKHDQKRRECLARVFSLIKGLIKMVTYQDDDLEMSIYISQHQRVNI